MSNTNDATIEVDDDAVVSIDVSDSPELVEKPDAGEAAPGAEAPAAKVVPAPEEQLAQAALQEALDRERKAREASDATAAAERKRAEDIGRVAAAREAELRTSQETTQQREIELLDTSIDGAQREVLAGEKDLKDAMEAGDFAAVAAANTKISRAAAKLDRLESNKADFEAGKTRRPTADAGRVEAPAPAAAAPFEQYVSQYAPTAQTWLRSHPDCVPPEVGGDPVKNAKMMQGHYSALAQRLTPNTPEYFAVIEKAISDAPVAAAVADPVLTPQPKPKLRAPQPSAPVSREAPNGNGLPQTRSVRLTPEQQEVARMSFPTKAPKEAYALYARNLIDLQAEGKIGRTSH